MHLRTSCKDQVHGVLAKLGVPVTCTGIFGKTGSAWLDQLGLPQPYAGKVTSLRQLTAELTTEITMLSEVIADLLAGDRGYQVIQQLPGIGPVLAAVITAEIGDVTRFRTAAPAVLVGRADPAAPRSRTSRSPAGMSPRWHVRAERIRRGDGRCAMAVAGGLDLHRGQLTFDYIDLGTGESWRGRISPADRESLRGWLRRFDGARDVDFAVEGCTGWRYVVEELHRAKITAHLAEPAETANRRGSKRRAKTDWADARHLRQLLAEGRVPESWIPPAHVLETRAAVRLYKDLLEERTSWQQRVHATLFHQGIPVVPKLGTADGQRRLDTAELSAAGRQAVEAGIRQIDRLNEEMAPLRRELVRFSSRQPGCRALRKAHYGIGGLLSVTVWAELGDCRRFASSDDAVRFTGLDITVHDSDGKRVPRSHSPAGLAGAALGTV